MSAPTSMPIRSSELSALHRATLARFIAGCFSESEPAWVELIRGPAIRADLEQACAGLGLDTALIRSALAALDSGASAADSLAQLLGHTVRSEAPPYELEYRASEVFQQSQTLADIAGFYRAFGFEPYGPLTERADFFATEWEFLAVLSIMEARAEDEEQSACCVSAAREFLTEHAAAWMPAFVERIRRADATSFLARVGELAEAVLGQWCRELDVAIGPRWLELRPTSAEDSTISCGAPGQVELGPALAAVLEEPS